VLKLAENPEIEQCRNMEAKEDFGQTSICLSRLQAFEMWLGMLVWLEKCNLYVLNDLQMAIHM